MALVTPERLLERAFAAWSEQEEASDECNCHLLLQKGIEVRTGVACDQGQCGRERRLVR